MSVSDYALRIKGIGKQYRLGLEQSAGRFKYKSLGDSVATTIRSPLKTLRSTVFQPPLDESNSFWALKDVSFDVKRGEVVGIIGRNGAGKSTLLKILSRITRPTTGEIELHGRVGSLLEVGTGFHPELSGRENIYLNGAVLGMTRGEVKMKFDEIVAFSEIARFLDTPVKQYSSGMYTRLAFAVAAHLEPEVLVIDEVLAVGDAQFQKKCIGKMQDVAEQGRTVFFVSHNMGTVRDLCTSALLLDLGTIVTSGGVEEVVTTYLRSGSDHIHSVRLNDQAASPIQFRTFEIEMPQGSKVPTTDDPIVLHVSYEVLKPLKSTAIVVHCRHNGQSLFDSFDTDSAPELLQQRPAGRYRSTYIIPPKLFVPGVLTFGLSGLYTARERFADFQDLISFEVEASGDSTHTGHNPKRRTMIRSPGNWRITSA